jgi:hypothetical protein
VPPLRAMGMPDNSLLGKRFRGGQNSVNLVYTCVNLPPILQDPKRLRNGREKGQNRPVFAPQGAAIRNRCLIIRRLCCRLNVGVGDCKSPLLEGCCERQPPRLLVRALPQWSRSSTERSSNHPRSPVAPRTPDPDAASTRKRSLRGYRCPRYFRPSRSG